MDAGETTDGPTDSCGGRERGNVNADGVEVKVVVEVLLLVLHMLT